MKNKSLLSFVVLGALYSLITRFDNFAYAQTDTSGGKTTLNSSFNAPDMQASYNFLVNTTDTGGILYNGTAYNNLLPLSYYDTPEYWKNFVCNSSLDCHVNDIFNPSDYTLLPDQTNIAATNAQTERVNIHNGTDIYDAATWQIAVMLGSVVNNFKNPSDAWALVQNQNALLTNGYDGSADSKAFNANRAITIPTQQYPMRYNNHDVIDPTSAYLYRMVTKNWLSQDPLATQTDPSGNLYVTASNLPGDNPNYAQGKITWTDWKPITGENAWAFLIGPLQASYINYVKSGTQSYVPFKDVSVQNAIALLPAIKMMQSAIGGIYYITSHTLGNTGTEFADSYQISVENNFSVYSGLTILQKTLWAEQFAESDLTDAQKSKINNALMQIKTIIEGDGSCKGLLNFFKNYAWNSNSNEFIQGGYSYDPDTTKGGGSEWYIDSNATKAVDVNTWGIAALGPDVIEGDTEHGGLNLGFGASYKAWQNVKSWGGYGHGTTIEGVGYSDKDGNGIDDQGNYKQGIMSAEWTAGAINMVQVMINYYNNYSDFLPNKQAAVKYASDLQADLNSMKQGIENLRMENYNKSNFPGKPGHFDALFPNEQTQPYLYSSKRYNIPFGWIANPIPSTCSTSWMIMLLNNYNPLAYGGNQNQL